LQVSHFSRLDSLNFQLFSACSEANERVGALQRELAVLQVGWQPWLRNRTMWQGLNADM
jgi:hypothetical protein